MNSRIHYLPMCKYYNQLIMDIMDGPSTIYDNKRIKTLVLFFFRRRIILPTSSGLYQISAESLHDCLNSNTSLSLIKDLQTVLPRHQLLLSIEQSKLLSLPLTKEQRQPSATAFTCFHFCPSQLRLLASNKIISCCLKSRCEKQSFVSTH